MKFSRYHDEQAWSMFASFAMVGLSQRVPAGYGGTIPAARIAADAAAIADALCEEKNKRMPEDGAKLP